MAKDKYTYSVKKRAKEVGDVLVAKHGLCAVFTLRDLNHEMNDAAKSLKEAEANAKLNAATMENVAVNNAWLVKIIKGLKPQQLHAMQMYFTARAKNQMYSQLADQSKRTLNALKREDKEVRALVTKRK